MILEVGGVGYKILLPLPVLNGSAKEGAEVRLFTYTHVREDALDLYGFEQFDDLGLFEQLLSVSGVGPKTAMSICSLHKADAIREAIVKGDVDFFSSVPRLGKKNAQKIIIELRQKLGSVQELDLSQEDKKQNDDVTRALVSLGFSSNEVKEALRALAGKGEGPEEKIRLALQYLGK